MGLTDLDGLDGLDGLEAAIDATPDVDIDAFFDNQAAEESLDDAVLWTPQDAMNAAQGVVGLPVGPAQGQLGGEHAAGYASVEDGAVPKPKGKVVYTGPSPESGHAVDTGRRCLTLYAYKYILKVLDSSSSDPNPYEDRTPIILGVLGHQGLALHYLRMRNKQQGKDPDEWATPEEGIRWTAYSKGPAWVAEVEKVLAGFQDYRRHYWHERLIIGGVEHVLSFKDLYGRGLTRSADLMPGNVIMDHKWVGRITKTTLQRYILDGQFLDYQIAAAALWGPRDPTDPGCRNGGVWVNLCEWQRNTDKPVPLKWRFRRLEIPPAPHALRRRLRNLKRFWAELDSLKDVDPWQWPAADNEHVCQSYGMCEGLELCRWGPAATRTGNDKLVVLP